MEKQGLSPYAGQKEAQSDFEINEGPSDGLDAADAVSLAQSQCSLTSKLGAPRLNSYSASQPVQRKFKSARLVGDYEKPWLEDKSFQLRERADKIILGVCAFLGFIAAGFICWNQWNMLPNHSVCTLSCHPSHLSFNLLIYSTVYS
jgi:hypothetical protein